MVVPFLQTHLGEGCGRREQVKFWQGFQLPTKVLDNYPGSNLSRFYADRGSCSCSVKAASSVFEGVPTSGIQSLSVRAWWSWLPWIVSMGAGVLSSVAVGARRRTS